MNAKEQADSRYLMRKLTLGDEEAATTIFDKYVDRLIRLVRLRISEKLARRFDADDVVQSAYRSFFVRAKDEQFVIKRSGDLWRLLATITMKKLHKKIDKQTAQSRDIHRETPLSNWHVESHSPTPDEEVAAIELLQDFMRVSTSLERTVLQQRLQGLSHQEIAVHVDRSQRTVRRLLSQMKTRLESRLLETDP